MNQSFKVRDNKRSSILLQVAILFAVSVVLTGIFTNITQFYSARIYVYSEIKERQEKTAAEVSMAVKEYPAYSWLLNYWCEHAQEMKIDYDDSYSRGSRTAYKFSMLMAHQPKFNPEYATVPELEALPPEDQKLYAEIVYSWLISRIDQIKYVGDVDYLFCVRTQEPYTEQFFVFSAADPGTVRGTEYEQVYPIGVTSEVNEDQQQGMIDAIKHSSHMAKAGDYVDYYSLLLKDGDHQYLIGLTYNMTPIMQAIKDRALRQSLIAMGYQVLLSSIILIGILFLVIRPLQKVGSNIRDYKDSKDSSEVEKGLSTMNSNNEIGGLAEDFTAMAKEIDKYVEELSTVTAEKERITTELTLGRTIQTSMLPHEFPPFPDRKEFDIFATMEPAREVGGDFYDFFMIDDDHLGLVIADVSGKGIPAALFMMASRIIVQSCAMHGESAGAILETTNNTLCANNQAEMFLTAWVGILEISTGRLTAANAGHEYPSVRKAGDFFELHKDEHGFVIGAMEDLKYKEYELQLEPGASIFVYTDGVPEASDPDRALFGTDRMLIALNRDPDAAPEQVLRNVHDDVDRFVRDAEQFDDLTMMCIKYNGITEERES